jgi:phage replication O-like protein O
VSQGTSPQLEDGYIKLANELAEALMRAKLTARQWPVAMAIIRKTYGFNKKVDDIGLSQLAEMTGIAKSHVSVAVRELEARWIIVRKAGTFGHVLGINKNYSKWLGVTKSVTPKASENEEIGVTDSVTGGLPNRYQRGYQIGKAGVTESVTTKDNPTKDNQKTTPKEICAPQAKRESAHKSGTGKKNGKAGAIAGIDLQGRFDRFYAAYPRKVSRKAAERAFARLAPDDQLVADILAGLERAKASGQWSDPKFTPHPATWLNAEGWRDEVQIEYSVTEQSVIQAFNLALADHLGGIDETIFVSQRAGLIRDFLTLSAKPDFHSVYFAWVRDNCDLPSHVGFDWLISRDAFTKIKGGQHERKHRA